MKASSVLVVNTIRFPFRNDNQCLNEIRVFFELLDPDIGNIN